MVEYIGFISEGEATNEALYARDFTNAAWSKTNITALLDATGIDAAANSCSTLTATAVNGTVFQSITLASAEFTTSFYVKRKTGTGTISITDDGGSTYTDITSLIDTSDFTRVQITTTQANPSIGFKIDTSGDEIEVDFAQLEELPFASSPIDTTTTAVTRSADNAVADLSDQPWFNSTEGTLVVNFKRTENIESASIAIQADDGTDDNVIQIGQDTLANDRQFYARVAVGGVEQEKLTVIESGFNNRAICAFAFTQDDFAFCVNGGDVQTGSSGDLPTGLSDIRIGKNVANSLYGGVTSASFFPTRKTNAELQELTTNEQTKVLIQDGVIPSSGEDINFSRSSNATYYDSDGIIAYATTDEERLHYFQDGSGDFGLLIEGERENIVPYSSILSTGWFAAGSSSRAAGAFDSPDGTTNATQVTFTASTSDGIFILPSIAVTTVPHTFSYFVKHVSGAGTDVFLGSSTAAAWGSGTAFILTLDASTGDISTVGSAVDAYNVEELPNGWYRVEMTGTPIANTNSTVLFYNATATAGVYGVFGVQVEVGSFASTWIETTGSAATRAKDIVLVDKISLKDWFYSLKGSFYCDFKRFANVDIATYAWHVDDDSINNRIYGGQTGVGFSKVTVAGINDGGVEQVLQTLTTLNANRRNKIAFAYEEDNCKFASNGLITTTDTNCTIPNGLIEFKIGDSAIADTELFGVIRNLSYINKRLTDFELFFITL